MCAYTSLTGSHKTTWNAKNIINQFLPIPKISYNETISSRKWKNQKATLITSSPFKNKLEERKLMGSQFYKRMQQFNSELEKGKQWNKLKGNNVKKDILHTDKNHWPYFVYDKKYVNKGIECVQWTDCKLWAHDQIIPTHGSVFCRFVATVYAIWYCAFVTKRKLKNQLLQMLNLFQTLKMHYLHTFVYTLRDWIMCLKCCLLFVFLSQLLWLHYYNYWCQL